MLTFLFGLTLDMYRPASTAMIADLVPPQDRARAYGVSFWAVNLGFSLAMILGGLLTRAGFTLLFWLDAVTSVLFGVLVWRAVPETRKRPEPGVRVAGAFRVISKDWLALAFVGLIFAQALVYMQSFTTFPLAMRLNGLPASVYGIVIALNGVLIIALQPVVGAWVARWDHTTAWPRARWCWDSGLG
ncbi:MFS transporter [Fodinicola feengrottensis]|uniref:MFS transporter n=1 Tax=Fodinicola feengrottensis TaxID=435914 RepID=UPI00244333E3|nr:MFS transporter [Fodinicola feengrottensis]